MAHDATFWWQSEVRSHHFCRLYAVPQSGCNPTNDQFGKDGTRLVCVSAEVLSNVSVCPQEESVSFFAPRRELIHRKSPLADDQNENEFEPDQPLDHHLKVISPTRCSVTLFDSCALAGILPASLCD